MQLTQTRRSRFTLHLAAVVVVVVVVATISHPCVCGRSATRCSRKTSDFSEKLVLCSRMFEARVAIFIWAPAITLQKQSQGSV